MRGTSSIENDVTPRSASARAPAGFESGARKPISTQPCGSAAVSAASGGPTIATTWARRHGIGGDLCAGLGIGRVGEARRLAGARLDEHAYAGLREAPHGVRHERDPALAVGSLSADGDGHVLGAGRLLVHRRRS